MAKLSIAGATHYTQGADEVRLVLALAVKTLDKAVHAV
jgi:hypothetical protein